MLHRLLYFIAGVIVGAIGFFGYEVIDLMLREMR